jgi:hypothetical protein
MITVERQLTSRLVALRDDSTILGYTQTDNPKKFLRELNGGHKLEHQVRIYEVCNPPSEAACRSRGPRERIVSI